MAFTMDFGAGVAPHAGWQNGRVGDQYGVRWEMAHLVGGAPNGVDNAYRIDGIPESGISYGDQGQHGMGWNGHNNLPEWNYGTTRYFCFYFNITTTRATSSIKAHIVQQGDNGGHARRIVQLKTQGSLLLIEDQFDGGVNKIATDYVFDQAEWHAVVLQYTMSSAYDVTDGAARVWFDNDTEGSPTLAATSIAFNPGGIDGPGVSGNIDYAELGASMNDENLDDDTYQLSYAGYRMLDTFPVNFFANMTAGAGSAGRLLFCR